jgi:hypothetical protein
LQTASKEVEAVEGQRGRPFEVLELSLGSKTGMHTLHHDCVRPLVHKQTANTHVHVSVSKGWEISRFSGACFGATNANFGVQFL